MVPRSIEKDGVDAVDSCPPDCDNRLTTLAIGDPSECPCPWLEAEFEFVSLVIDFDKLLPSSS